jgi:hypothetical protein
MEQEFVIEKFEDFNDCMLSIQVVFPGYPVIKYSKNGEKRRVVGGYGHSINHETSKQFNYRYEYYIYDYENQQYLHNEPKFVDFEIFVSSLRQVNVNEGFQGRIMTAPVTTMDEIILISRSEPFTSFDKIFLPFEIEVWHWLIGTLTLFVAAIFIFKFTPGFVQRFVFGSRVKTPMLNMM